MQVLSQQYPDLSEEEKVQRASDFHADLLQIFRWAVQPGREGLIEYLLGLFTLSPSLSALRPSALSALEQRAVAPFTRPASSISWTTGPGSRRNAVMRIPKAGSFWVRWPRSCSTY